MSLAYLQQLKEPRFVSLPLQQINTVIVRTWRQRFFTWPWRPWIRTTTITVPDPQVYWDACTMTYSGHPVTLRDFRQRCEEFGRRRNS